MSGVNFSKNARVCDKPWSLIET